MSRVRAVALALAAAMGLAVVALPTGSAAPRCPGAGTVEHVEFSGSTQGSAGGYSLYLPACYVNDDSTRYPSVYLLHGLGEDDTHWLRMGVAEVADAAITRGDIAPLVLVMADGGPRFEAGSDEVPFDDYLIQELVPHVDATYRTVATRAGRAVGGISRGGGHALTIAAKAPGLFTAAGGHSPRVGDAAALASALTDGGVRVWLDVGAGDYLHDGSVALARLMRTHGGSLRLHVPAGVHESAYWQSHVDEYLMFYGATLRQGGH